MDEVQQRLSRKNKVLFAQNSAYLHELTQLTREQKHRAVVLWALEFAKEAVGILSERYRGETRPGEALRQSRQWAEGLVKMPAAQKAILGVHAFAKEIDSPEDIALCHAVGQACGTVHTAGHAMGLPMYELTAIVRGYGIPDGREPVERRMAQYIDRILYWGEHYQEDKGPWADFMLRDEPAENAKA